MKIVKANKGHFHYLYWLIDLLAIGIVVFLAYLLWLFVPVVYDKVTEKIKPKAPAKGVIVLEEMDRHCPETKGIVVHMFYYNRETGKKVPLVVGSSRGIKTALATVKDKDAVMTYECFYN